MSYDVALFFRGAAFPLGRWEAVIAGFGPRGREVSPPRRAAGVLAERTIPYHDGGALWLELRDVRDDERHPKPAGARWEVFLSRGGHGPRDAWLQFAVAYHALVLMGDDEDGGPVFYDLQDDVYAEDQSAFLELTTPKLRRFGLAKMFGLGLLDAHGEPVF